MRRRAGLIVTGAVVLVGVWAFYELAVYASRGGAQSPMYSLRRYDPYGTAAFGELLVRRDVVVGTLERPRLDGDAAGVLVQVLPVPGSRPSPWMSEHQVYELPTSDLADWIAQGNTLVQLTRHRTELMRRLGVPDAKPHDRDLDSRITDLQAHQRRGGHPDELPGRRVLARAIDERDQRVLLVRDPLTFALAADDDEADTWRPLWHSSIEPDRAVAGVVEHGEGRLIVIGAPTPALNHGLIERDNVLVLLELVGDGPVIFDEWSHGVGHIGTIMELIRDFGLLPAVAQLVLVVLVYHWSTRGYRRVDRHQPPRPRASIEQVHTLGHLYRQSMGPEATAVRIALEVRHRLAQAWRCPPDQLEHRLASVRDPLSGEAEQLLRRARALTERVSDATDASRRIARDELTELLTASHQLAHKRQPRRTS